MLRARVPALARPLLHVRYAASARAACVEASSNELQAARKWLAQLHADTIPRSIGELTFSRSSGPGGQNVNKYACPSSMFVRAGAKSGQE